MTLDEAISRAIDLNSQVVDGDLGPVYADMEAEMEKVSNDYDISTLLPGGPNAELGMAARKKDARSFYSHFRARVRANLCSPDGEFSKMIAASVQGSVGAIVASLATALALPVAALGLLVPIAVLIVHSGLEAFCSAD